MLVSQGIGIIAIVFSFCIIHICPLPSCLRDVHAKQPSCSPRNDISQDLRFFENSDAIELMKQCNWTFPTVVTRRGMTEKLNCCATGYLNLSWYFKKFEEEFEPFCENKTNNSSDIEIAYGDSGIYRCVISKPHRGERSYDQRLVVSDFASKNEEPTLTFGKSCPSNHQVFDVNKKGRKDIACEVSVHLYSRLPVFIEIKTAKSLLVRCKFYPICDAVTWTINKTLQHRCVLDETSSHVKFAFSVELTPKLRLKLEIRSLHHEESFTIIAKEGKRIDGRTFTIRPPPKNHLFTAFGCLFPATIIALAIAATFFNRDIRLLVHRRLFDYEMAPTTMPLLVLKDPSRTDDWLAEQLVKYLTTTIGHRFRIYDGHSPGDSITRCITRVPVCVVVLDSQSLFNAQFCGHLKQLLSERYNHRVYILMEPFSMMHKRIASGPLNGRSEDEIRELHRTLSRVRTDKAHRDFVRMPLMWKLGLWRPTSWIFRQVRLSVEIMRCQIVRTNSSIPTVSDLVGQ